MDDRAPQGYASLRQNSGDDIHSPDDEDRHYGNVSHRQTNSGSGRAHEASQPRRSSRYKDDLFDDDDTHTSRSVSQSSRRSYSPPKRKHSSPAKEKPPIDDRSEKSVDRDKEENSSESARCKARYMGSVVIPKDGLDLTTVRRKAQKVMRVGRPYNMTLNIRDSNIIFDCEARYISFPARRVYASVCEPCETGTGLWIVEEPRPGSYLCHVLEGDDEDAMVKCEAALLEATGGWRLKE